MIETISGVQALENLKSNPHTRWGPQFELQDAPFKPEWAVARLEQEIFETNLRPSFKMKPGDMIFASGSCFAQNIELNLLQSGMSLLYGPDFFAAEASFADIPEQGRRTTLTMYNTPNIMRFATALETNKLNDNLIYEQGPGLFVDYTVGGLPPANFSTVMRRREVMRDRLANRLSDCACVIFTLGLSEAWYDRKAQDYLNYTPDLRLLKREANRFELHVLDYNKTVSHLEKGISALRERGVENIVITVSPVPLISTFTSKDVIVANEYSKSVLRAAAEYICTTFGCDYFPSYELVRYSDFETAWNRDRRHPKSELIGMITRLFSRNYIEGL
ncbi:hypothetical protein GI582_23165 [Sulfitobacter sp. BDSS02]|nr:hypothetical protein [Sulfitobacter sp. BDSS02]